MTEATALEQRFTSFLRLFDDVIFRSIVEKGVYDMSGMKYWYGLLGFETSLMRGPQSFSHPPRRRRSTTPLPASGASTPVVCEKCFVLCGFVLTAQGNLIDMRLLAINLVAECLTGAEPPETRGTCRPGAARGF